MSKTKGIILFRSDDLNGATSEILLETITKKGIGRVIICNSETINQEIKLFLDSEEYRNYSTTYIVGLGFDKKLADRIETIMLEDELNVVYRDHHRESLDLSKYMWGRILLKDAKGNPISSAKNLFREIVDNTHPKHLRLSILIDMANAAITGYTPVEDEAGKSMLEELYSLAGSSDNFAKSMTKKIQSDDAFFNEADILAKIEAERRALEEEEEKIRQMKEKLKRDRNKWLW